MARPIKNFFFLFLLVLIGVIIASLFLFDSSSLTQNYHSVLQEIRTLSALTTAEHFYQFVFPFDFLPDADVQTILANGQPAPEHTPPLVMEAYRIAQELGLLTHHRDPSFIVINTHVKAGFSFDTAPIVNIEEDTIEVVMNTAEIQFVELEDIDESYAYPRIEVDARGWQKIAAYVRPRAVEHAKAEDILQHAQSRFTETLSELLRSIGFSSVVISFK